MSDGEDVQLRPFTFQTAGFDARFPNTNQVRKYGSTMEDSIDSSGVEPYIDSIDETLLPELRRLL